MRDDLNELKKSIYIVGGVLSLLIIGGVLSVYSNNAFVIASYAFFWSGINFAPVHICFPEKLSYCILSSLVKEKVLTFFFPIFSW
ncbi:hypothetical protein [Thermococcus barophilus]|uniref:hypothetical protein n=1 Tax=Thermococcus barophilus TaxID=55802 RepID=UPI00018059B6|nr:hypothetical protein [Thermococcus barophilus]